MSLEEENKFIQEIRRFVNNEKLELSSTSESESSPTDDNDSVKFIPHHISSDSDDDYFKLKARAININIKSNHHRLFTSTPKQTDCSSSEPDLPRETSKQDSQLVNSASSFLKISSLGPQRKFFKRKRRTDIRGEKRRVDESVRRVKEKFQNRTLSAQGEWRQSKTFGLGVDVKNRSASKENSILHEQEKLEVQEVICRAVGEPFLPCELSTKDEVSDSLGGTSSGSKINSIQSLRHFRKCVNLVQNDQNDRVIKSFSVDLLTGVGVDNSGDAAALSKNQWENRPTSSTSLNTTVPTLSTTGKEVDPDPTHFSGSYSRTTALSDEGSYSPPSDSPLEVTTSFSSDTLKASPLPSSRDSSGLRDTSRIPKSPWFRGKTPSETSESKTATLSTDKELSVPCVRIEHYIHFSESDTPFILINGEKIAIQPEQWLEILEVASVEASLIV